MAVSGFTERHAYTVPDMVEMPYGLYPPAERFDPDNGPDDYRDWVDQSNGDPVPAPLALYFNTNAAEGPPPVAGGDISSSRWLEALQRELSMQGALFDSDRPLEQLLWPGKIATEWSDDEVYRLVSTLRDSFTINNGELTDWCLSSGPVLPAVERLRLLRVLGFSSMRFVFQNRPDRRNALDKLLTTIAAARELGYSNIALDIVHNWPGVQVSTEEADRFLREISAERIWLKVTDDRQYHLYVRLLSSMGYRNIGNDCFVRTDDNWLRAKTVRSLHWSLLGFTLLPNPDVIGIGPGALSSVGDCYAVNATDWESYQAALNGRRFPVIGGLELEDNDILRREIMRVILADSVIPVSAIEEKWGIRFNQFFAAEVRRLREYEERDWVDWRDDEIRVRVYGHRQLTELCRVFDQHLREMPLPEASGQGIALQVP
jgi:oxygen-independent coproporphyrinogen-3 oxidase